MFYEHTMHALYTKLAALGDFRAINEHGLTILSSPTTCAGLNLIFGSITEWGLASARHIFQERPFSCITTLEDNNTHALLHTNGYQPNRPMPEMMLELSHNDYPPLNGDIVITPVISHALLYHWCIILAQTFELPLTMMQHYSAPLFELQQHIPESGIELLIGFFQHQPAMTALVHREGQTACISSMAVVPEFQRKGLGSAMLQHCLAVEAQRGTQRAVLVATQAGRPLYEKFGFEITRMLHIFCRA